MRRIGIYGSSFDPITYSHMFTAAAVASRKRLDKVYFTPCSSMRRDKILQTEDRHRVKMLELALGACKNKTNRFGEPLFEISLVEMNALPGETYTYDTMEHFRKQFPDDEIFFIMGADLLEGLSRWGNAEKLVKNHKFIVMSREGYHMDDLIAKDPLLRNNDENFLTMSKGISMGISSSYIRGEIRNGGDPSFLLPDLVLDYIYKNQLYTKEVGR
ncbi:MULTISPECIES: nicotinate (nicotinamide) nucleotide adenylyltransferase [Brevibacillus]|jgi:nicotinate-nucleotide adenylyltransferase|uniref:nicotinate (nicotinamide) nucleotide adenylyltransferase n=1 Tax=Brevibacillus TaxID=55080 RepID=UPI00046887CA|nr:nicotinate (nicotinamide) nucleotide adenylyltransferase [Brevibacillus borstelensis]KKX53756.1 nicotinate-nucleotide adenylyltransferase [Brevibacillus borstelensis cifa_chp40]MBE5396400.1 nicotinate (nicotinamide) nucleotide adenylyltransferase [Brevibacillus borstelensis]MCC0565717.1 nicotinate (nicotinamide) nucleotide adenylyltransferase [Brevibacillus borstelensis]MCM3472506.1 nicotinate (nicotinamide) nucleotide adenylyltransferase [Brevibacillus borstelensis]MCM3560497.1 nicotinate 